MTLYIDYADEIESLIASEALPAGQRLPSVREVSRRRKLSVSTVLQAYRLLEARGLIDARPRSGYYVSSHGAQYPQRPHPAPMVTPAVASVAVDRSELIHAVLHASRSRALIPLGSAFPDPQLFPFARLRRAVYRGLRDIDPHQSVEDLSPGNAELRRQIAIRYHLDGHTVDPEEIVITHGALEALNLCLQAVTRPGDTVLIESPTFYGALQSIERLGRRVIEIPIDPATGLDLARLRDCLATQRPAACWLMPTFQNPTGALMSAQNKRLLVELLCEHDIPLIEDDAYGELYYGTQRPPPAHAFDTTGNVLHCGTFSKCLAPGYRIGWAMPGRFAAQVLRYKLESTLAASLPAQVGLARYLGGSHYDRHLHELRAELHVRRDRMIERLHRHLPADIEFTEPDGGYVLWLRLPQDIDARELHRRALEAGVAVAPGVLFSTGNTFAGHVRLNYGHPKTTELDEGIARLGTVIDRWHGPRSASSYPR